MHCRSQDIPGSAIVYCNYQMNALGKKIKDKHNIKQQKTDF